MLKSIGSFFKSAFGFLFAGADKTAKLIAQIAEEAIPVVAIIASLTPTRADDELIRLFERFAVPWADYWLALPVEKRGAALIEVASAELAKRFPRATTSQIRVAIEGALVLFKGQAK